MDAIGAIDSALIAGLHTTEQLRDILGDRGLLQRLLAVEAATAEVQAELGLIPTEAAVALATVDVDDVDIESLGQRSTQVGYPILGLVEQLAEIVPDGHGQWAHWGLTTQDVMDTALVLQVRDALDHIEADMNKLIATLQATVSSHRTTLLVGRSQGQHALPTTFGYRAAGWLDQLLRHLDRLHEMRDRVQVIQLGGAVGTLASLAPNGLEVRRRTAEVLGLGDPDITWHALRDRIVEVVSWSAQLSASLAKIGLDIALSAQTELAELVEGTAGTSSTMPQKRNAIISQQLVRGARLTRTYLDLALDAAVVDHDRPIASWSLEWSAVAPALAVTGGSVAGAVDLIGDLQVDANAMATNLARTDGLIMAEAVMMQLAKTLGRQHAHDAVHEMVEQSREQDRSFASVVREHAPEALQSLEPADYLGHGDEQVAMVLARATHYQQTSPKG